jgi:lysophospholipase L1-like esterase
VSDIQILKNSIQAQLDQFAVGASNEETAQARVEADNTVNTTLKARLDKKEAKFTQDIQTLSTSLAQKANKDEINTLATGKADKTYVDTNISTLNTKINSQASGSPKGTYATLAALQTAFPTGNTNIYLVTADGKWYYWSGSAWTAGGIYQATKLSDRGTTENKLNFTPVTATNSINLYNRKDITQDFYIPYNTGVMTALAKYSEGGFIPAYENTAYCRTVATHTTFWDSSKNFISGTISKTFTTPSGTCYIRIAVPDGNRDTEQLELGSINTAYDSYGVTPNNLKEKSISKGSLATGIVEKENMAGLNSSINLFNIETVKKGFTVGPAGENTLAGYNCSDFINVEPSTQYTISSAWGNTIVYYDDNNQFISSANDAPSETAPFTFTTLPSARKIRINIRDLKLSGFMMAKGSTLPAQFVKYENVLPWLTLRNESVKAENLELPLQTALNTKWKGKKIVTFGDSITWYDGKPFENTHIEQGQTAKGYQSYMREQLGCTVDNQGYSGAHIKLISSSKIKGYASYADVDSITITSGANDHRIGFAPGTVQPIGSAFNLDTYAGAFQDAIEYLLTQKPSLKIYLITPVKGWYTAETSTRYNGENIISKTYINIMKQIAELYSLPILDWYHLSGINDKTYYVNGQPHYIGDNPSVWTAYQLHPTNSGYKRMADILIPFLNNN